MVAFAVAACDTKEQRVLPILLSLFTTTSGFVCPPAQQRAFSLVSLKGAIKQARTHGQLQEALASLASADRLPSTEHARPEDPLAKAPAIDDFADTLVPDAPATRVLQVRYLAQDDEWRFIAVLLPIGPDRWCALGDLSGTKALTFSFVRLLSPASAALQVDDVWEHYEGTGRGEVRHTTFLTVRDAQLRGLFSAQTYAMTYQSPCPPTSRVTATITRTPEFPPEITYRKTIKDLCPGPCRPEEPARCGPERTSTRVFRWNGKRFADVNEVKSYAVSAAEKDVLTWLGASEERFSRFAKEVLHWSDAERSVPIELTAQAAARVHPSMRSVSLVWSHGVLSSVHIGFAEQLPVEEIRRMLRLPTRPGKNPRVNVADTGLAATGTSNEIDLYHASYFSGFWDDKMGGEVEVMFGDDRLEPELR